MSLSSFFEEKFDERRTTTFCHRRRRRRGEEEGAKNDDGISINRGKLRKNSRLGFSTKKKRSTHTKLLPSLSIFTTRKNNKARARGCSCVCVCVCRFRE